MICDKIKKKLSRSEHEYAEDACGSARATSILQEDMQEINKDSMSSLSASKIAAHEMREATSQLENS